MSELTGEPTDGQIRLRAYYIWQWLGCPDGYENEIWSRAESELKAAYAKAASPGERAAAALEVRPPVEAAADLPGKPDGPAATPRG